MTSRGSPSPSLKWFENAQFPYPVLHSLVLWRDPRRNKCLQKLCGFGKLCLRKCDISPELRFAIISAPTRVRHVEDFGWGMSLTLFSPCSATDGFFAPFINVLALVQRKKKWDKSSKCPNLAVWKQVTNGISRMRTSFVSWELFFMYFCVLVWLDAWLMACLWRIRGSDTLQTVCQGRSRPQINISGGFNNLMQPWVSQMTIELNAQDKGVGA